MLKSPHIQKCYQGCNRKVPFDLQHTWMKFGILNLQYWSNASLSHWIKDKWIINSAIVVCFSLLLLFIYFSFKHVYFSMLVEFKVIHPLTCMPISWYSSLWNIHQNNVYFATSIKIIKLLYRLKVIKVKVVSYFGTFSWFQFCFHWNKIIKWINLQSKS